MISAMDMICAVRACGLFVSRQLEAVVVIGWKIGILRALALATAAAANPGERRLFTIPHFNPIASACRIFCVIRFAQLIGA
jgi:hypothetical protein